MTEAHIEPFSNEELMAALADEIDKAVPDVIDVTDDAALEFARKRAVGDIDPATCATQIEALLMVADQPMSAIDLATFLEVPVELVNNLLEKLSAEYRVQGRGFDLRNIADGWRFYSAAECADVVSRFATDGRSAKISQASLETLAVVAYKQPVSRARISAIRGVSVDGVMRTLINRGLVVEVETEPVSGAGLYGTTVYFLERMGMKSLDELPPIEDHLPDLAVLDELIEQAE